MIGLINPTSQGRIWILAATKCYTKRVKVIVLKWAIGVSIANFIQDNVICHFGIPKSLLSNSCSISQHAYAEIVWWLWHW